MNNKNILVTWWLWYIWSHCVVELEKNWYNTIILDNLSNSNLHVLDWIKNIIWYKPKFFNINLLNKNNIEDIFKSYKFYWVIHFAWLKAVWESCDDPFLYYNNNIIWTLNLLETMNKYNVKNIIFSSSATVYKKESILPWDENSLTWETNSPYWTTKLIIENLLRDLSIHKNFNIINLRYFNPIWNHESWFIWEDPKWIPNNIIPYIMKVVSWEYDHVKIFWNDYKTIDWTWVRDYIHVLDLIDGHLKSLNFLEKSNNSKWIFENINLWYWYWTSVLQLIKITSNIIWKEIKYVIYPRRNWDIDEFYCDSKKAKDILNWIPKYNIELAIKSCLNYLKKKI